MTEREYKLHMKKNELQNSRDAIKLLNRVENDRDSLINYILKKPDSKWAFEELEKIEDKFGTYEENYKRIEFWTNRIIELVKELEYEEKNSKK